MRRWGLAWVLGAIVAASPARTDAEPVAGVAVASDAASAPADPIIGYGAMPGGLHVAAAATLPAGTAVVETLAGFGYRKGLLGPNHRSARVLGDVAAAFGATSLLTVGISLDGRYDRHYGLPPDDDHGYVGDPHLFGRVAKAFGAIHVGVQLGIWAPGSKAPSLVGSATSIDLRALLSIAVGRGLVTLQAGFQNDNSIKSADNVGRLTLQDRTSLGVSDYNEAHAGAHLALPVGSSTWLAGELSVETFVGAAKTSGAAMLADGKVIARATALAGIRLDPMWSALAFVELAKVPGITAAQSSAMMIPVLPYEPAITFGVGLQARFGGTKATKPTYTEIKCDEPGAPPCKKVETDVVAEIAGTVVDDGDRPIAGAKVTLTLERVKVDPVVTDAGGGYVFKVKIGSAVKRAPTEPPVVTIAESAARIGVEVDGKKPGSATVTPLKQDANVVPPIKLESKLPPGQLKIFVKTIGSGKPIANATVSVSPNPGDRPPGETDRSGFVLVEVPPGTYKVTVKAPGMATQELDAVIDPNGVTIKNVELHK